LYNILQTTRGIKVEHLQKKYEKCRAVQQHYNTFIQWHDVCFSTQKYHIVSVFHGNRYSVAFFMRGFLTRVTSSISGAETVYSSRTPEFTPGF